MGEFIESELYELLGETNRRVCGVRVVRVIGGDKWGKFVESQLYELLEETNGRVYRVRVV